MENMGKVYIEKSYKTFTSIVFSLFLSHEDTEREREISKMKNYQLLSPHKPKFNSKLS